MMRFAPLLLLLFVATGCSKKIRVESDTCWEGNVNGGSVSGCGETSYTIKGDSDCFSFQKTTDFGYLRIKVTKGSGDEPSTSSAYGVVSGCIN